MNDRRIFVSNVISMSKLVNYENKYTIYYRLITVQSFVNKIFILMFSFPPYKFTVFSKFRDHTVTVISYISVRHSGLFIGSTELISFLC